MKKTLIALFFVALVVVALVAVNQSRQAANHEKQLAATRAELEQSARAAEELQAANQQLAQEKTELRDKLQDATAFVPAPVAPTAAPARAIDEAPPASEPGKADNAAGGMGKLLAKMMDDPDMRKLIRDQQRQTMDTLYAPLAKQLGLTPEQAEQFKDFIADTQMKGVDKATSLFSGSSSNRTEAMTALVADQKTADEQIKAFLGDERYALYKDYQLTLGERMQLAQFKTQTAGSENALTDQQTEMLLALMKEEKQNVAAMAGQTPPGTGQDAANMQAMLSGETDRILQSQELVNQRVFERARNVLPESQLNSFGRFQTNQLQMMRVGVTMAKKMFAPDGGTKE